MTSERTSQNLRSTNRCDVFDVPIVLLLIPFPPLNYTCRFPFPPPDWALMTSLFSYWLQTGLTRSAPGNRVGRQPEAMESGDMRVCLWVIVTGSHFVSMCGKPAESFLPVFLVSAISSRGNANGCFDSWGRRLKKLFYYVIHVWPMQPEPVGFKLWRDIAASAKCGHTSAKATSNVRRVSHSHVTRFHCCPLRTQNLLMFTDKRAQVCSGLRMKTMMFKLFQGNLVLW